MNGSSGGDSQTERNISLTNEMILAFKNSII